MRKECVSAAPPFRALQHNLRCYIADIGVPFDKLPIMRPNLTVEWSKVELVDLLVDEENPVTCPICLDEALLAPRVARCGHAFCWLCILKYINFQNSSQGKSCPLCLRSLCKSDLKPVRFQMKRKPTVLTFALLTQEEDACTAVLHPDICEMVCGARRLRPNTNIASSDSLDVQFWDVAFTDQVTLRGLLNNDYLTLESMALNTSQEDTATYDTVVEALKHLNELGITVPSDTSFPGVNDLDNIEESIRHLRGVADSYVYGADPRPGDKSDSEGKTKNYCFYQSIDGFKVLLHPLLLKCLWQCCGQRVDRMPLFLVNLPVLGLEEFVVTRPMRRRYNWLHHIRLGSKVYLAQVPLEGYVPQEELEKYLRERQISMDMKYSRLLQSREES